MSNALSTFDASQTEAIDELTVHVRRMNEAIKRAVDAGLIIEMTRASRLHSPEHVCWGDQMSPKISAAASRMA